MLTNQDDRSLTKLKARLLLAVAVEALTFALLFQDREIWWGVRVSLEVQFGFALIVSIAVFVYLIHAYLEFANDCQESIMAIIAGAHTRIERECAEAERCLSSLEAQLTQTRMALDVGLQPTEETRPAEFELAYRVRVAMDCIRFAVKASEQSAEEPNDLRQSSLRQEANLQLLDALDRLKSAEMNFQRQFRTNSSTHSYVTRGDGVTANAI